MLVLTRKLGEEIVVGGRIKFSIVQIDGDRERVRIGIEAPPEIAVHRGEIFKKVLEQNLDAVLSQQAELQRLARYWGNIAKSAGPDGEESNAVEPSADNSRGEERNDPPDQSAKSIQAET